MKNRLGFLLNRVGERLWVKPLLVCALSVLAVYGATFADNATIGASFPKITADSLEKLLTIMASSMLVIATFAVASMVSSYSSASNTATPRSFTLVVADDVSQNALSTFIGAFIFSIVAIIFFKNGQFNQASRFALFVITLTVFAVVILTFVKWVDRIARLGRLGATIDKVEAAAAAALRERNSAPTLGCARAESDRVEGQPVYGKSIGYVQRIDVSRLQQLAEKSQTRIRIAALPGTFVAPGRVIAYVVGESAELPAVNTEEVEREFVIGDDRTFDHDPRFGLIVLSEIASRALSPAVNDPGTAIDVINTFVRLFALTGVHEDPYAVEAMEFDRVEMPEISTEDMFDDAFTAIARDGAGVVEVAGRLQKAFASLAVMGDSKKEKAARRHSRLALARAEKSMRLPEDLKTVRELSKFVGADKGT